MNRRELEELDREHAISGARGLLFCLALSAVFWWWIIDALCS